MAIPEKPLEFDFAVNDMPLEAAEFFDPDEWEENPMRAANSVRKFLIAHSKTWTKEEIKALTIGDLGGIITQVGEAIKRAAVPLAN